MQGWARAVYPLDWPHRYAVVIEYLAQLNDNAAATLIKKDGPDAFAAAERYWSEAFSAWKHEPAEQT